MKFGLVGFRSGLQTKKGEPRPVGHAPEEGADFYFDAKGRRIKGSSTVCGLDDTPKFQKCKAVNLPAVKTIKVRILDVYGKIGKKQAVGIAEVEPRKRK